MDKLSNPLDKDQNWYVSMMITVIVLILYWFSLIPPQQVARMRPS